jgi:arylsulfatase A
VFGLLGLLLTAGAGEPLRTEAAVSADFAERPNLVIINIDDLGYGDIGPFGSTLNRTPNLDRMAREGRRLTSFYAAPMCTPSRASLMTGCYTKRVFGIDGVSWPGDATGLSPAEITLPRVLHEAGYATAMFGKWHLGDQPAFLPRRHGFDVFFGIPYSNDMGPVEDGARSSVDEPLSAARQLKRVMPPIPLLEGETVIGRMRADEQASFLARCTARTIQFITDHRNMPFFVFFTPSAVHFPYYPAPEFRGRSRNGSYGDWVEEIDARVGELLETLRRLDLERRTLVLFTSDNGAPPRGVNAPLRGFKHSTYEGGVRVPTIAWWPERIRAGTTSDVIASVMDILPTFARLAGADLSDAPKIDGLDILPALTAPSEASAPPRVFYYFYRLKLEAVREGPWKLRLADGTLYHLDDDIGESVDRSASEGSVVARLQRHVAAMENDLGLTGLGPGCRAPGRVSDPRLLIEFDGPVSEQVVP